MRKLTLFLLCLFSLLFADETLLTDTFNKTRWRAANTSEYAKIENQVMKLEDERRYLRSGIIKDFSRGSKFRLVVEGRGTEKLKIGFFSYGEKITQLFSQELQLSKDFAAYEYVCEIPERARQVTPIIQGSGEYRKVILSHVFDPDYQLVATPPYQMTAETPTPITFTLYHQGKIVENATFVELGQEAFHRESGATAYAWIDKAETAKFDAAAKDIRLAKAVNILYLGDSLTHFDIGHNHVDKVGFFLNKYNPGKAEVFNYACGGDDIQRIVNRLDGNTSGRWGKRYQDLWSRSYDWAFVFLGHNDTKASSAKNYAEAVVPPERQRTLYEDLLSKLKAKGIQRIILMSASSSNFALCQANSAKLTKVHNRFGEPKHLEAFNSVLKELAQKHHLEYLDVYEAMKALSNKAELLNPNDGVHLTTAGHDFIAIETLKYLSIKQ
ncbi:MAG: SGNH/GDSL hydrolase family protein [Lentisphaeria bacterium]